jgi:hypothetical protein
MHMGSRYSELGESQAAISEDGFLVTNEHVVRDATQVRLVTSAGFISAQVVTVNAANDLSRFAGSRRKGHREAGRRCRWRRVAR